MADAPRNVGKDAATEPESPETNGAPPKSESKPPRRRRRWWIALGFPLLVLALLVWFAPAIVARTDLRHRILPMLVPDYPAEIRTGGADLGWLSPVVLRDVTFAGTGGEPLLEVESIETSLTLWELATHSGDVGRLRFVTPVIHVRARSDGSNVEDVVAAYLENTADAASAAGRLGATVEIVTGRIELSSDANARIGIVGIETLELVRPLDPATGTVLHAEGRVDDGERTGSFGLHVELRDEETGLADLSGRLVAKDAPLEAFGPLLARWSPGTEVSGRLHADIRYLLDPLPETTGESSDGTATTPQPRSVRARVRTMVTHLDARLPGVIADERLMLERVTLRGDAKATIEHVDLHELELVSDVGRVAFDGRLPFDAEAPATVRDWLEAITNSEHELVATVDLERLVTVLPRTTRVRDDLKLHSGTIRLDSSTALHEGRPAWTVHGRVSDLAGTVDRRDVRWDEPLYVEMFVPVTDRGPEIERLSARADFAELTGRRVGRGVRLNVDCDLDRLERELARFVDLGDVELAGRITGAGTVTEADADRWTADLDLRVERFVLAWPNRPRWTETRLELSVRAVGRGGANLVERIETGRIGLDAGDDQLELRLTDGVPWTGDPLTTNWPVAFKVTGDLERWQTRLGPFVALDEWSANGNVALDGEGTFSGNRVIVETCKGGLRGLRLTGPGVRVVEPTVSIDVTGEWDGEKRTISAPSAVVAARTAAVRAVNLQCDWSNGGPPRIDGGLALRGDLAGVQRWMERQPAAFGQVSGSAKFQHRDGVTKSLWKLGVTNLAFDAASVATGTDPNPVRLNGRLDYEHARDSLAARGFEVVTTGLSAKVDGRVAGVSSSPVADLAGELVYDWQRLAPRLRPYLGEIAVAGSGTRAISMRGPLDFSRGIPPTLVASGGLGWQSINAHGIPVGPGDVTASVANGSTSFAPLDVTVAGGRLRTTPHLATLNGGTVLSLSPDTVLSDVQLTPELTSQWLAYATPLLANGATANGRLSVAATRTSVRLANWKSMDAVGVVRIDEAHVTPGPMAAQLVAIVDRLRTLSGGGAAGERNTTLDASAQTVNVRVTNGRVLHDRFTVTVGGMPVTTTGSVGFDNTLDLVAEMAVPDGWVGNDRIGRVLAGRTLRIPIRGTTSAPMVDSSVLTNLGIDTLTNTVRDRIGERIDGELSRGLERLTDGLFGPSPRE